MIQFWELHITHGPILTLNSTSYLRSNFDTELHITHHLSSHFNTELLITCTYHHGCHMQIEQILYMYFFFIFTNITDFYHYVASISIHSKSGSFRLLVILPVGGFARGSFHPDLGVGWFALIGELFCLWVVLPQLYFPKGGTHGVDV